MFLYMICLVSHVNGTMGNVGAVLLSIKVHGHSLALSKSQMACVQYITGLSNIINSNYIRGKFPKKKRMM